MNRILTTSLVFLFLTSLLFSQKANPIFLTETHTTGEARMCTSNAGTIQTFGPHIGQSNDVAGMMGDTIFLCMGDSIFIDHANDEDLSGDPNTATPAGIGYTFFNCAPTTSGPMVSNISNDGCITNIGNPEFGFYVYTGGTLSGDVFFFNDGNLQTALNNGNPGVYYFAPITFDEMDVNGFAGYEGNPVGNCVHLNNNEAFIVAYLNEVRISSLSTSGCTGNFRVRGGLPELNNNSTYTVNIFKQDDPGILGVVNNSPFSHNDIVNFTAPEPGLYVIEVEDGKSCGASTTIMIETCDVLLFDFPLTNVLPGTNECLPVLISNFNNIASIQGTFTWDPSILTITSVQGFHPLVPDLVAPRFSFFPDNANLAPGVLTFSWNETSGTGVTLNDNDVFFEICFDVIGQLGECSPLGMSSIPTGIEVINSNFQEIALEFNEGTVCISEDPFFTLIEQDSVSCPTFNDGAFTITVDEGAAPYFFSWNSVPAAGINSNPVVIGADGGSETVTGLSAGLYQVTITDSSNPTALEVIDTFEIFAGPVLGITISDTTPSCFNASDGSIVFLPTSDGFPVNNPGSDYSFVWSVPNGVINPGNTFTINNTPAGSYGITVTDPAGCTASALIPLGQPPAIRVLDMNTTIMDASCTGGEDGTITITAIGGTTQDASNMPDGIYTYEWSTSLSIQATTSTIANLNPGEYSVTVTDDNGCTEEVSFTVGATKVLSINGLETDVSCNGDTDGVLLITGSTAGAPPDEPYSFSWSANAPAANNTMTTSELMNLGAGIYYVTMTDSGTATCEAIDSFTITEPTPLIPSIANFTNETCIVGNDGSITIQVTGGTYPYSYSWSHDALLMDSIATGLSQGNYTIDITDNNNCVQQLTQMISAPTPPLISSFPDASVTCANDVDGQLLVTVSPAPGTSIINYQWSTGQSGPDINTINTLAPGEYIVTITADNQCTTIDTALVTSPAPITLDDIQIQMPNCPLDANGQIAVVPTGGTPPYSFEWSNGMTSPNVLTGLVANEYQLTITDSQDCVSEIFNIVVADPPSIIANFTNQVDTSCPDDTTCDGQLTATAFYSDGTSGDFNFQWASGENTNTGNISTAVQLCEGPQSVVINDGVCGIDTSFTINAPEQINANTDISPASCNGDMDGSITITPSGGTAPYSFLWIATGDMTNSISNLGAGDYSVVIIDANNCTLTQNLEVVEPDILTLTIDASQTTDFVTCAGDMDGVISVIANGGNTAPDNPYSFSWDNSSTQSIITNLDAGTYSVSVTDFKNCMAELSFSILEPPAIEFTINPIVAPLCFGDATEISIDTVTGGAGNPFEEYTFMIDNNGLNFPVLQAATVFAGDHLVTVEDINGCTEEQSVSILAPAQINIDLPASIVVELGDSTVQLNPVITPSGNYTYLWTPADFLSSDTIRNPYVFPANSLDYNLTIINEFGCTASESIFVELDANRNVYIPNIFSPNGDGYNDKFEIFTCTGVKQISSVRLFDRWGGILYEGNDIAPSCLGVKLWDGQKKGKTLPAGVYVYMIEVEFLDNVVLTYRGDVTILR